MMSRHNLRKRMDIITTSSSKVQLILVATVFITILVDEIQSDNNNIPQGQNLPRGNVGFMHNKNYKISSATDNAMVMSLGHERYLETGHGLVGSAYAAPWNASVTQMFHADLESDGFRLGLMTSPPYPPLNYVPVLGVGKNNWTMEPYTEVQQFLNAKEQQWIAEEIPTSSEAVLIKNVATDQVLKWPGRNGDRIIPLSITTQSLQDKLTWWILTEIN